MKGKGIIQFFAIALVVVCIYQLSFTWVSNRVQKDATEYSENGLIEKLDSAHLNTIHDTSRVEYVNSIKELIKRRKRSYLDSISNEIVYDIFLAKYTFQKVKERELNLGLDLRGGMSVTLQVSLIDLLKSLSNNSTDTTFLAAIKLAQKNEAASDKDFITLFGEAYNQLDPEGRLAIIFATQDNKDYVDYNSTNAEVLEFISTEGKDAIGRTFNILRTRIDQFGVTQPNISLQENSARIIVELPGVDDPARVRKLLQASAKLEFWETYKNEDVINNLGQADEKLKIYLGIIADTALEDTSGLTIENDSVEIASDSLDNDSVADNEGSGSLLFPDGDLEEGPLTEDGDVVATTQTSLFSVLIPAIVRLPDGTFAAAEGPVIGTSLIKDTFRVNRFMAMDVVLKEFSPNIKFLWGAKTIDDKGEQLGLYAIKTSALNDEAPLGGDVITSARQDYDPGGQANILMGMNSEGARIWQKLTAQNIGNYIAIVLDDIVYSAPEVMNEISGGRSSISGNFEIDEAKDIANILKAGKFPTPARIIEEAIVGPTLGQESIEHGLQSLLAGFLLVLIFMFFYYSMSGGIADIALLLNIFFIIGVLASFGATLTLPGIAGLVLTIGMCVDANVIIFERIREEISKGKGMRLAIIDGYKASYSAIIDANLTTLLAAIILAHFGAGPILGFAIVLIIGIITSLFSAVLLTQIFFDQFIKRDKKIAFSNRLTHNAFKNINFNFIKSRKIAYVISGLIIIGGLTSIATRGLELGVDFKGGRSYTIRFNEDVNTGELKSVLEANFEGTAPLVRTFGGNEQVKITTSYLIEDNSETADSVVAAHLFAGIQQYVNDDLVKSDFDEKYFMGSQKVGPTIADDIKRGAYYAIIFGILGIFLYILIRFRKWQFGLGAIVAIFHDVLLVLSVFSILNGLVPFSLEVDQALIAAILTIIGYSINDTVVIFDRIREYVKIHHNDELGVVLNKAVNNTLSRTIVTSLTTLLVIVTLFLFGGEVIRGFAFALMIGIIAGTYSSVFIATPLVYDLSKKNTK